MPVFGQQYVKMNLGRGGHQSVQRMEHEPFGCAMEWVALLTQVNVGNWATTRECGPECKVCTEPDLVYLAGFTDAPSCVDTGLRDLIISLNDGFSDTERQRLIPYLRRVINTAGFGISRWRHREALDTFFADTKQTVRDCDADAVFTRLEQALDLFDKYTGHVPMTVEEWDALLEEKMVKVT